MLLPLAFVFRNFAAGDFLVFPIGFGAALGNLPVALRSYRLDPKVRQSISAGGDLRDFKVNLPDGFLLALALKFRNQCGLLIQSSPV